MVEAKAALRRLKLQLLQGQLQLTTGTATAYSQFEAARAQLDAGWQEYQAGVQQLADSRAQYEAQRPMPSKSWTRACSSSPTLRSR